MTEAQIPYGYQTHVNPSAILEFERIWNPFGRTFNDNPYKMVRNFILKFRHAWADSKSSGSIPIL